MTQHIWTLAELMNDIKIAHNNRFIESYNNIGEYGYPQLSFQRYRDYYQRIQIMTLEQRLVLGEELNMDLISAEEKAYAEIELYIATHYSCPEFDYLDVFMHQRKAFEWLYQTRSYQLEIEIDWFLLLALKVYYAKTKEYVSADEPIIQYIVQEWMRLIHGK